jgi:hypothetical protein
MKNLIFLVFIFCCVHVFAQQEWAPTGAKWYYSTPGYYPESSSMYGSCITLESIKDTIIKNLTCKILELRTCNSNYSITRVFIHQSNDSIFYYNENYENFFLLYNFSAKIGDTVSVHNDTFTPTPAYLSYKQEAPFEYKVVEIDSIEYSGIWLKRQKVTALDDLYWLSGLYIVEKLGSDVYFFGRSAKVPLVAGYQFGELRCYSDNTLSYKSLTWNDNCDYTSIVSTSNINNAKVYPNPAKDFIVIEHTSNKTINIEILDELGRNIYVFYAKENQYKLSLATFQSGIYFLKIINESNLQYIKFIKL